MLLEWLYVCGTRGRRTARLTALAGVLLVLRRFLDYDGLLAVLWWDGVSV